MASGVMKARKKYAIKYPAMYAPEGHKNAKEFDCVQRAHQNSLENLPAFMVMTAIGGLRHPIATAISAAIYIVGRAFYFRGYSTGSPEKRMRGGFMYIGSLALYGIIGKWAYELIKSA
jgi:glutathione S-transferase